VAGHRDLRNPEKFPDPVPCTGRRENSVGAATFSSSAATGSRKPSRTTGWTGMRATKHTAPRPWRSRGLVRQ